MKDQINLADTAHSANASKLSEQSKTADARAEQFRLQAESIKLMGSQVEKETDDLRRKLTEATYQLQSSQATHEQFSAEERGLRAGEQKACVQLYAALKDRGGLVAELEKAQFKTDEIKNEFETVDISGKLLKHELQQATSQSEVLKQRLIEKAAAHENDVKLNVGILKRVEEINQRLELSHESTTPPGFCGQEGIETAGRTRPLSK